MSDLVERQRERLARYRKNCDEIGEAAARELLVTEYVQVASRQQMFGEHGHATPLAACFARFRPLVDELGVREEFLDASADGVDAALAIQVTCTCRNAGCTGVPVLCEAYLEATRRSYPEITAEALLQQIGGAHVCVFRFSRQERTP